MNEYDNPWTYKGNPMGSGDLSDYYGFVYLITNNSDGKKYIGKKLFYSMKTKQVKKKKKRYKAESDWKEYYGSSAELQEDIELLGKDRFTREIIHLCKSKGECNYMEAHEQFERRVLLDDNYYNSWIMVKVRKSHVLKLTKESVGPSK